MNRDKTVAARLSAAERHTVEVLAQFEQMKPSEVVRLLIREGALQRGLHRPITFEQPQQLEAEVQP